MKTVTDLTGRTIGRLTVLREHDVLNGHRRWHCVCQCGGSVVVAAMNLKRAHTKSCGCLQKERTSEECKTHGLKDTPEYNSWCGMKQRCYDQTHKSFKHYGGRGIFVCERWIRSFENFLEDMGKKPSSDLSIDRINVNGNYDPSNCRWATAIVQANNKRNSRRNKSAFDKLNA